LVGQEQLNLFQVLLPAVALHGSFDFVLFLLGALGFMFDWTTTAFELSSLFVALAISTGGGIWAYYSFKRVEGQYREGWRPMADEETIELNSI